VEAVQRRLRNSNSIYRGVRVVQLGIAPGFVKDVDFALGYH
jgi:hypothetical protein